MPNMFDPIRYWTPSSFVTGTSAWQRQVEALSNMGDLVSMPQREYGQIAKESIALVSTLHKFEAFRPMRGSRGIFIARITNFDDTGWLWGWIGCCRDCDPSYGNLRASEDIGHSILRLRAFHHLLSVCRIKDGLRHFTDRFAMRSIFQWLDAMKEETGAY